MFNIFKRKPKRLPSKVLIIIQNGDVIGTLSDSKNVSFYIVDTDRKAITSRKGPTIFAPAGDIQAEVRNHILKGYSLSHFRK